MDKEIISFQIGRKAYPVRVSDIVRIEREGTIIRVRMSDAMVLELRYTSLAQILRETQSDRLVLCNRSMIVNRDYIYAVDPGNRYITLRNNWGRVDIGIDFKEKIMEGLADREDEFLLRLDNIRYVIRVGEFLCAKSSKRFLHIFLRDGREFLIAQKPIEYILRQVRTDRLMRCARGVLVNRDYVEEIDVKRRKLLLANGEWLEIGSNYMRQNFIKN